MRPHKSGASLKAAFTAATWTSARRNYVAHWTMSTMLDNVDNVDKHWTMWTMWTMWKTLYNVGQCQNRAVCNQVNDEAVCPLGLLENVLDCEQCSLNIGVDNGE